MVRCFSLRRLTLLHNLGTYVRIPQSSPKKTAISIFFLTLLRVFFRLAFKTHFIKKNQQNYPQNPSNNSVFFYFFVYQFRTHIFEGQKRENQCFV